MDENKPALDFDLFRSIFTKLYEINQNLDIYDLLDKSGRLLDGPQPWVKLYELPFKQLALETFCLMGVWDEVLAAAIKPDANNAMIELAEKLVEEEIPEQFEQNLPVVAAHLQALLGSVRSIQQWHLPIDDLVRRAKQGDEIAMFKAISVDQTILSTDFVASYLAKASVRNDLAFFDHLCKAIKGSWPARPKQEFDELRFMMEAVFEVSAERGITSNDLHKILVGDLELHPGGEADQLDSIRKLIQKRNRTVGT